VNQIVLFGLGLIGGSIGKALTRAGWRVSYIDPVVTLPEALASGAAEEKLAGIGEVPPGSFVLLAAPLDISVASIAEFPSDGRCLVTTACSVMGPLRRAADQHGIECITGHPFAGSQAAGLAAADERLFEDKKWFIEAGRTDVRLERLIAACGAEPVPVSADEHDRTLAITSHLPQLLSSGLAALVAARGIDLGLFAGSGLKSFLRLAAASGEVWHPVLEANREPLEAALSELAPFLEELLHGDDEEIFREANAVAKKLGW
jgi:prephenate dehydrogenase